MFPKGVGGNHFMIQSGVKSRDRLLREWALTLGQAIDISTWKNYGSILNSYLTFVKLHNFLVKPTPNIISFFIIFMCYYIKPDSVDSYLSGICQQLEPYFPSVRQMQLSILCKRTLASCKHLKGVPTKRKRALTMDNLHLVVNHYSNSAFHNDLLFVSQLLTGFFALLRLGELMISDNKKLFNHWKITSRTSVILSKWLPFLLTQSQSRQVLWGKHHHHSTTPYLHRPPFSLQKISIIPRQAVSILIRSLDVCRQLLTVSLLFYLVHESLLRKRHRGSINESWWCHISNRK